MPALSASSLDEDSVGLDGQPGAGRQMKFAGVFIAYIRRVPVFGCGGALI